MSIHVDRAAGIATITLQGELAGREVAAAFDQVLHHADFEPGMNTLWDLREARVHAMSGADVRGILFAAGPLPTPVMVFRDIDDAKRWLTSRPDQRR